MCSLLVMVSLSLVRKEARYHCKGTLSRRNFCRNWTRGVSLEVSHNYGQRMHFVSLIRAVGVGAAGAAAAGPIICSVSLASC